MATHTAVFAQSATLTTTTVDTITLSQIGLKYVEVLNVTGTADLWVTIGTDTVVPATPVASADDTYRVRAGEPLNISIRKTNRPTVVKILGNGNEYSVTGQLL